MPWQIMASGQNNPRSSCAYLVRSTCSQSRQNWLLLIPHAPRMPYNPNLSPLPVVYMGTAIAHCKPLLPLSPTLPRPEPTTSIPAQFTDTRPHPLAHTHSPTPTHSTTLYTLLVPRGTSPSSVSCPASISGARWHTSTRLRWPTYPGVEGQGRGVCDTFEGVWGRWSSAGVLLACISMCPHTHCAAVSVCTADPVCYCSFRSPMR